MLKSLLQMDPEKRKKISMDYFNFLLFPLIALGVLYLIFFIFQIIDLITELVTYESEIFLFYYLRYIFAAIDVIMIGITIGFSYISFTPSKGSAEVTKYYTWLLFENYKRIIIILSICLFGTSIPRLIMLINHRDLIGTFVAVLIYIKIFVLVPLYMLMIVIYIIAKEVRYEDVGDKD